MKSEENEADIFTKNSTTNTIFQNHQKKLVGGKGKVNEEESQELTRNEIQHEGCQNLNQIRTDRQTVGLRFSWESVLTHIAQALGTQKGIVLDRRSPESDLPHMYLWMDETVYKWIYV